MAVADKTLLFVLLPATTMKGEHFYTLCLIIGAVKGWPKVSNDNGFQPVLSPDQVAVESNHLSEIDNSSLSSKTGRFGFPTYTGDVQGSYPGNSVVPGLYGPIKLDIGGLVLGTIVGLGAFFILPKLLHVVTGPYVPGGYKRSEGDEMLNPVGISEFSQKFTEIMAQMNVDSSACMQRAICSAVQSSENRLKQPNYNSIDNLVDQIAKNEMLHSVLAGARVSDWKKALETGLSGGSCGAVFNKCPFTMDSVIKALVKYFSN